MLENDSLEITGKYGSRQKDRFGEVSYIQKSFSTIVDFSALTKMSGRDLYFEAQNGESKIKVKTSLVKIKGDEHIIGLLDREDVLLDYNERRINLFNKSTQDLIKLNQSSVNEIHRLIYRQPLLIDAL